MPQGISVRQQGSLVAAAATPQRRGRRPRPSRTARSRPARGPAAARLGPSRGVGVTESRSKAQTSPRPHSTPRRSSSSSRSACSRTTAASRSAGYARDALPFLGCWFGAARRASALYTRGGLVGASSRPGRSRVPAARARPRARPRPQRSNGKEAAFLVVSLVTIGVLVAASQAAACVAGCAALGHDPVDQAVVDRLLGRHEVVAVDVLPSPARRRGPVWREMISAIRRVMLEDLARRDLDVGRACRGSRRSPGGS